MKAISYTQVKSKIEKANFKLLVLEQDYKNTRQKLKVECICGGTIETTLSNIVKMKGCRNCAKNTKKEYTSIKKLFEKEKCELLTEQSNYLNVTTKVKYTCSCGAIAEIIPYAFSLGQKCFECGKNKRKGENHPNYRQGHKFIGKLNPNWNHALTDEERKLRQKRGDHKYKEWRSSIYQRDNYVCQKCFKRGGDLNVHHIENFALYPEKRYDTNNGITLCKKHHEEFHKLYGKKSNNKLQLEEYFALR